MREAGGSRLTETGLSLGTPHYMSPEQATADREVDARSDVYSLGAMVYEMLAGRPPHAGSSLQAVIASVLTKTPPPVDEDRPSIPPELAAVVHRSVERLPADRFQTAAELGEALKDPPVPGRAAGAAVRGGASGPGRAAERLAWAAFAVVLALGAVVLSDRDRADDAASGPLFRFELPVPAAAWVETGYSIDISPDGQSVASVGRGGPRNFAVQHPRPQHPRMVGRVDPDRRGLIPGILARGHAASRCR